MNKTIVVFESATEEMARDITNILPESLLLISSDIPTEGSLYLRLQTDGLWLYSKSFAPFHLDLFYAEFIAKRSKFIAKELLIRAANPKGGAREAKQALDLTAGLGRDSIILALAGYKVTMLENNPYLAVVLNYLSIKFAKQLVNLQVIYTDHNQFLTESTNCYDLIYYDPMFEDGKMALAKKDMQLIDLLVKSHQSQEKNNKLILWQLLKTHCQNKIIVKRDNKQQQAFANIEPTYSIKGKTIRFDVYQC